MKGTHNTKSNILFEDIVVITLINIPKFERNSQPDDSPSEILNGCNYFDKYIKIWKELTTTLVAYDDWSEL